MTSRFPVFFGPPCRLQAAAIALSLLAHGLLLFALGRATGDEASAGDASKTVAVSLIQRPAAAPPAVAPPRPAAKAHPRTVATVAVDATRSATAAVAAAQEPRPEATAVAPQTPEPAAAASVVAAPGAAGPSGPAPGALADSTTGTAGGTFSPPTPQRTARPVYPWSARRNGWEGDVLLRVEVDPRGGVSTVRVERSSGHQVLDRAASQAVRSWRFRPARHGLQPVTAEVRIPVQFRLAEL